MRYPARLWDLSRIPVGEPLRNEVYNGLRITVLRGPMSLCAYVGLPLAHPLAGRDCDDMAIDVHGGFTYAGEGFGALERGLYWYGWDYAHAFDLLAPYQPEVQKILRNGRLKALKGVRGLPLERRWTIGLVEAHARNAADAFVTLAVLPLYKKSKHI